MITAFTFVKNAIEKGQPLVECLYQIQDFVDQILVVDMGSTDNTIEILNNFDVDILTTIEDEKKAFLLNVHAKNDKILHFRPDEIFDTRLLKEMVDLSIDYNIRNISAHRIVVEQNFQRVRWYPEAVHRIFKKGTVELSGPSTNKDHLKRMSTVSCMHGYIWAFQCCFLDNLICEDGKTNRFVPPHFMKDNHFDGEQLKRQKLWDKISTPLNIPNIMLPHLGKRKYNPYTTLRRQQ